MKEKNYRVLLRTLLCAALFTLLLGISASATYIYQMPGWTPCPTGGSQAVVTGYASSTSTSIAYRFTVGGYCSLRVTGFDNYGAIHVTLYDGNQSCIEPNGYCSYGASVDPRRNSHAYYALKPGTYYVEVTSALDYFKLGLICVGRRPAGGTKASATYLPRGYTSTSLLPAVHSSKGVQWFKIVSNQRRNIKLNIKSFGRGYYDVLVFGGLFNGKRNAYHNATSATTFTLSETPGALRTGTYYIAIVRNGSHYNYRSNAFAFVNWNYY